MAHPVVTASKDWTSHIWDAENGKPMGTLEGHRILSCRRRSPPDLQAYRRSFKGLDRAHLGRGDRQAHGPRLRATLVWTGRRHSPRHGHQRGEMPRIARQHGGQGLERAVFGAQHLAPDGRDLDPAAQLDRAIAARGGALRLLLSSRPMSSCQRSSDVSMRSVSAKAAALPGSAARICCKYSSARSPTASSEQLIAGLGTLPSV
jgi:hypothetical protein